MKAGTKSHRIGVDIPTATMPVYQFGKGWVEEEMGSPRVMGDATLLPNGMIVLLNGAEVGSAVQTQFHRPAGCCWRHFNITLIYNSPAGCWDGQSSLHSVI